MSQIVEIGLLNGDRRLNLRWMGLVIRMILFGLTAAESVPCIAWVAAAREASDCIGAAGVYVTGTVEALVDVCRESNTKFNKPETQFLHTNLPGT